MSALDSMLEGTEQFVIELAGELGPVQAEEFVDRFNNACVQMSGFEPFLDQMKSTTIFYAPMYSLSLRDDH